MSRDRIVITGASGTLGSALVAHFAPEWDVVQLDEEPPESEKQEGLGEAHIGSFLDPVLVREALAGATAVVHSGAIPGSRPPLREVVAANVQGTFNVLEAAGESPSVERFVYISSIMQHGFHDDPPGSNIPPCLPIHEDLPPLTEDCYGTTKVQAEQWCRRYAGWYKKPVTALRPANIIGASRLDAFAASEAPPGPHLRDYVGVWDVVDAVARALDYHPPGGFEAFLNNADDQYTTLPSLELVARSFPGVEAVDRAKLAGCSGFGALVDCARAKEKLGWAPAYRCRRAE